MAIADKERVKAEIAVMDPAVKAAIEKAAAEARAAKKQGKIDKVAKVQLLCSCASAVLVTGMQVVFQAARTYLWVPTTPQHRRYCGAMCAHHNK